MSFPTPSYLTRRASSPPSLVLLVFLQPTEPDPTEQQQLAHDRLAIALPADASVAQLHSLIEQRYQQLLSDEQDGDGDGERHRIAVRRVYKVAEFAYVVSKHETVGDVFGNEEPVQADVSIAATASRQSTQRKDNEETKEGEEKEEQQDGDSTQQLSALDDSQTPLTTPTLPTRSASLFSNTARSSPPAHRSRATPLPQSQQSPPRSRASSTLQAEQPQSSAEGKEERKERAAVEEVEGGKKLDKQLAQRFNTSNRAEQASERADLPRARTEPEGTEQMTSGHALVQEGKVEAQEEGEPDTAVSSPVAAADHSDVEEVEKPQRRKRVGGERKAQEAKKKKADEKNQRSKAVEVMADNEKQVVGETSAAVSADAPATLEHPMRPSAPVAGSPMASEPAQTRKRGRKRKNAEPTTPALSASSTASPSPAPSLPSSSSSSASPTTSSLSLSALPPASPLAIAGPSVRCVLCGQSGGVLKLSDRSSRDEPEWCHQMCGTWCDGTYFEWKDHRVHDVSKALQLAKRKRLQCRLCQQPSGSTAPVQCMKAKCAEAFHITCGVAHGYQTFEVEPDEKARRAGIQEEFAAACPRHTDRMYDERNDDECCICLYTRPSQPEMSGRLTCMQCGVRVHRTCYYNLPSDSVGGSEDGGLIDWRHWTCMCCEYQRSGIYYFVNAKQIKQAARKKSKGVSYSAQRTEQQREDKQNGEEAEEVEEEEEEEKKEQLDDEAEEEEKQTDGSPAQQQQVVHFVQGATTDEDGPSEPRANGKRRTPAETRGSGTSNKRQKMREEAFKRTGFSAGRASQRASPSSPPQNGESDNETAEPSAATNSTAAAEERNGKAPSQRAARTPLMSPVTSRAAAVLQTSPPLPMAKNLDPRRTAAIRRLEENASREKLLAKAAQQPDTDKADSGKRTTRSLSTGQEQESQQQQHRASSGSLIINCLRASTSATPVPQTAAASPSPSPAPTPASPPRSALSRKEYSSAVSRYSVPTLRAVLHHHGLNYTGTREGLVARLLASTPPLPADDERQQWEQAWERDAGEDKDKHMLRMPDREFERHRQERQSRVRPDSSGVRVQGGVGGGQAAVAGFGPVREVKRLSQSAGLAKAVEDEEEEEGEVDDMEEEEEEEEEEVDSEDDEEERQEDDEPVVEAQRDESAKLREAMDSIEEVEDSSEDDRLETHRQNGNGKAPANARGRGQGKGRGSGRGRGDGRGGRGRGGSLRQSKEASSIANGRASPAEQSANGQANGRGRGRGRGKGRPRQ